MIGTGWIVRRRVQTVFDALGRGEWDSVIDGLAEEVRHVFPGDHPLGGERHSRDGVLRWFERLEGLYPGHEFDIETVASRGPPWDLRVAVQWTARLTPCRGPAYENPGAHWIRIRRGRVTEFHAYLDTQLIARACERMAREGIEEAAAPPIVD